eukprot:TRINITY_DN25693_c0_g1_i1.p1 TRINITY_DN25693_c0_g1~~TRINITY_DN25693_c0_g1_i1.p1  ORF type:complete len:226 (+),score=75.38 TRINITY_DN25693_c0_g1_i1:400-1077(+)
MELWSNIVLPKTLELEEGSSVNRKRKSSPGANEEREEKGEKSLVTALALVANNKEGGGAGVGGGGEKVRKPPAKKRKKQVCKQWKWHDLSGKEVDANREVIVITKLKPSTFNNVKDQDGREMKKIDNNNNNNGQDEFVQPFLRTKAGEGIEKNKPNQPVNLGSNSAALTEATRGNNSSSRKSTEFLTTFDAILESTTTLALEAHLLHLGGIQRSMYCNYTTAVHH